jgi:hypothetical protein
VTPHARPLIAYAAAPRSCSATCATHAAWPAANAACRAAPLRARAAPMAFPPAARDADIVLTARPATDVLERLTWPRIGRSRRLEEVEHVLGALGRPERQTPMVRVGERAAPATRDQARVAVLRKDHGSDRTDPSGRSSP